MDTRLFQLDPMAASSYGLYNSLKEGEGSFVDFLLSYDSKGANDGDNSWLTKAIGDDMMEKINSPEVLKVLSFANINTFDLFASMDFFDTQVSAYKLQLQQEIAKRDTEKLDSVEEMAQSISTNALLQSMSLTSQNSSSFFSTSDYFDAKINAYKIQLQQELAKRESTQPS